MQNKIKLYLKTYNTNKEFNQKLKYERKSFIKEKQTINY